MPLPDEAKNSVKATETTFAILEELMEQDGARVTDLANELNITRSSAHNYLSTLNELGYVKKQDRRYDISLQFLELGAAAREQLSVYASGKKQIRELAEKTGELANLMVEEHGKGVYIHRETGKNAVRVDVNIGQRVYLHNTALGKAILAYSSDEYVEKVIDHHGLPETTNSTITDRDELHEELKKVRKRGVAIDDEERLNGLRCVAAPILDAEDKPLGAVSVAGPTSRISNDRLNEDLPEAIQDAVNIIELNVLYG